MTLIARRLLVLGALAAVGALIWVFAARPAPVKMGIVEVTSEPGDAKVFINGQRKGDTPTEPGKALVLNVPEGRYRLEGLINAPRLRWERRDLYVTAEAIQPVKLLLAAVEPEMVSVPAGTFLMGSNTLGDWSFLKFEHPLHPVDVPGFAIGKYEVTFAEWDACVADDGCTHTPGDEGWGRANRPVMNVSWDDAQQYVAWLSRKTGKPYRLPSEAEWEYAARAGTTTDYSTGDRLDRDQANYGKDVGSETNPRGSVGKTQPVGSYAANPWGLYDVHGHVNEWVEDCWNLMNNYSGTPTDGSAYAQTFGNCSSRVIRGGSWANPAFFSRSASRDHGLTELIAHSDSKNRNSSCGFRVALTLIK